MKRLLPLLLLPLLFACTGQQDLQSIAENTVDNKLVHGTVFSVLQHDTLSTYAAGNLSDTTQYFIASITKLYTTAIVMKLRSEGKLSLEDKISQYLPEEVMDGLHVYQGKDYSHELTIRHLLSQTSGLPDYYEGKAAQGTSMLEELLAGQDQWVSLDKVLARAKQSPAAFAPRNDNAFYSDTNWQLLQAIVETITQQRIVDLFAQHLFEPLGLKRTYVFVDIEDTRPIPLYYKEKPLFIPKAISGFNADGGIVSTSEESLHFLKAFYTGALFPKAYLAEMQDWNAIMYPLEYGMGMMRFKLPSIMTGGTRIELIGHAGSSGAFAFYDPARELYLAGTVNQLHKREASFQLMAKILGSL